MQHLHPYLYIHIHPTIIIYSDVHTPHINSIPFRETNHTTNCPSVTVALS